MKEKTDNSLKKLKMSDIGEFAFIRSIQDGCHFSDAQLIQGIGDDCAVIGPYGDKVILVTTDLLLEDVHFILDKIPPDHLGEKALNVNLSDIAAMGGTARHALVSLAVPGTLLVDTAHALYRGIKGMCRTYGVNLMGGDTSASVGRLMINVTVIGDAPQDEVLYRSGARPGDGIYITGTTGDSAGGLKLILGQASAPEPIASALIAAHHRPQPHLEAGRMIARSRLASAMIDVSDGLVADLRHVCEASCLAGRLFQEALPLSDELKALGELNGLDPYALGLFGGEDYRLLFTVPEINRAALLKMFENNAPCPIFRVGEMLGGEGIEIVRLDGTIERLEQKGFEHFG